MFTFRDKSGKEVQQIRNCINCIYRSTAKHFGDDGRCPLCGSTNTERQ